MTTVIDPRTQRIALVVQCRSCAKPMYWGYTEAGKRCPYDVDDQGQPTDLSHFKSCPDASAWSKRK